MNWWQRALTPLAASAGFEPRRDVTGERLWTGGEGGVALSGVYVSAESGQQHWAVQAVMAALAGPVSTLPLMVFERLDGDRRRPARDHPLFDVLHRRPNGRQTAQEYRDDQERHLAWWRNAYARIVPDADGGPVGALEPIHPSRVLEVRQGADGHIYYKIQRLAPDAGHDTLRDDEIHHIRKAPLTLDGLRGRPVWETARETIGRALAVEEFGALFFANGGAGGGVLKHPGDFRTKEDEASFLSSWRSGGTGRNRHRDRLLKFGVEYTPFQVRNDEAQFLETKKQAGYELAGIWNMPPHRAGMLERATNNNIEQQSLEFVMYALGPDLAAFEQAMSRDLLIGADRDRYFIEFNVAGLLRGDLKGRWTAYFQGRQGGWLSINDVRRLENMDPIGPEGDVYETALNMKPAGQPAGPSPAAAE